MVTLTDSNDIVHGTYKDIQEALDYVKSYSTKPVYYIRQVYLEDNRIMIDYGSHTHFFYLDNGSQI